MRGEGQNTGTVSKKQTTFTQGYIAHTDLAKQFTEIYQESFIKLIIKFTLISKLILSLDLINTPFINKFGHLGLIKELLG